MGQVTVQNLELKLNFDAKSDKQVFDEYFDQRIQEWDRNKNAQRMRQAQGDRERSLNQPGGRS